MWVTAICLLPVASQAQYVYESPQDLAKKAVEAYTDERYEDAFVEFMKINKSDTAYFDSRIDAILCASALGHNDTIIDVANEALSVKKHYNPSEKVFINAIAVAYNNKEEHEKALEVLEDGLKKYPDYALMHQNQGTAYAGLKKYDEAVKSFQMAIRYDPKSYLPHYKLGLICAYNGDLTKAMLCFNMACLIRTSSGNGTAILVTLEELGNGKLEKDS